MIATLCKHAAHYRTPSLFVPAESYATDPSPRLVELGQVLQQRFLTSLMSVLFTRTMWIYPVTCQPSATPDASWYTLTLPLRLCLYYWIFGTYPYFEHSIVCIESLSHSLTLSHSSKQQLDWSSIRYVHHGHRVSASQVGLQQDSRFVVDSRSRGSCITHRAARWRLLTRSTACRISRARADFRIDSGCDSAVGRRAIGSLDRVDRWLAPLGGDRNSALLELALLGLVPLCTAGVAPTVAVRVGVGRLAGVLDHHGSRRCSR